MRNNPANGRVNMRLEGRFDLLLYRSDGRLITERHARNIVVSTGENLVASRMFFSGAIPDAPRYIAFGTSGVSAVKTQTALLAEFAVARFGATASPTSFVSLNLLHLDFVVVPTITMANVSEVGVFNATTVGIMMSRTVIVPFTMTTSDSLKAIWELEFLGVD